ncbi:hypothetical protein JCM8097_002900 [Rhodosporidiobolus ruineniae]
MTSMTRRNSAGVRNTGSDEDDAPPLVPPKPGLLARAAQGGYQPVQQHDADLLHPWRSPLPGERKRSWWELGIVGEGTPRLGTAPSPRLVTQSLSRSTYTCPDPRLPRPNPPNIRQFSKPVPLPAASPDFSLSLSYSTTTCNSFVLLISRTDIARCREMERTVNPASDDPTVESWIRTKMGPDSFNVQLEGAERVAVEIPSEYRGDCRYLYRFRLNNAGKVWMNVTWTYEDYQAFFELDAPEGSRPKPAIFMRPLVSKPVELDLCPSTCRQYTPPRLGPASSAAPAVRLDSSSSGSSFLPSLLGSPSAPPPVDIDSSSLPTCHHSSHPLSGSYIPSPHLDLVHPPYPVPLDTRYTRPTAGLYSYVPSGCVWRHAGRRFVDHTSCITRPHSALLMGDSHARGVFDVVKHRLEGSDSVAEASPKALNKNAHVGNLYMEFAWDPYMTAEFSCDYMLKFDSIAFSSGTHQLSWNCPRAATLISALSMPLRTWPRLLRQCHAQHKSHKSPQLVFLTMPAFHPQLHNHDCRTGPRITYVNQRLSEIALEEGWEVLDVEGYVKPVAVDQIVGDGVHYLRLDAAEPIADEYLDILGICNDVEG